MFTLPFDEFYKKMASVDFDVYGILDTANNVHTLGTDSKLIGRIFEIFTQPVLESIAKSHGLLLETPKTQTAYPDFTLMTDKSSTEKIAVDVKTTYIKTEGATIKKFTLGSFGSYIRNNTKNIQYPYTDYAKHYVIGFVYKRNGAAQESSVMTYDKREQINPPYSGVRYFIQEKYKIAGDKPASGDTENIGSFSTKDFSELKEGRGPFSELGPEIFELYWKYYPRYRSPEKPYTTLKEFLEWAPQQEDLRLLYPCDLGQLMAKIEALRDASK